MGEPVRQSKPDGKICGLEQEIFHPLFCSDQEPPLQCTFAYVICLCRKRSSASRISRALVVIAIGELRSELSDVTLSEAVCLPDIEQNQSPGQRSPALAVPADLHCCLTSEQHFAGWPRQSCGYGHGVCRPSESARQSRNDVHKAGLAAFRCCFLVHS